METHIISETHSYPHVGPDVCGMLRMRRVSLRRIPLPGIRVVEGTSGTRGRWGHGCRGHVHGHRAHPDLISRRGKGLGRRVSRVRCVPAAIVVGRRWEPCGEGRPRVGGRVWPLGDVAGVGLLIGRHGRVVGRRWVSDVSRDVLCSLVRVWIAYRDKQQNE